MLVLKKIVLFICEVKMTDFYKHKHYFRQQVHTNLTKIAKLEHSGTIHKNDAMSYE